jgi:hypothetical protein
MAENIIKEINSFETFKFDNNTNRIINMRFQEETNIDEFLSIQHLLDTNKVMYKFDKNFDIQVVGR